ncbi:TPA: hypothetical protein QCX59_005702, partial [Bacillus mycoides]|nr:hypothetical protein [Bacillus mycoides]
MLIPQVREEMDSWLHALEKKEFNISELANNEGFLTVDMHAYLIALKTHQKEKRIVLMNSISNTPALGIEENEKLMFLNYIDQFNKWYLKILSFLKSPESPESYFTVESSPKLSMGGKATILVSAFPELVGRIDFFEQIVKELKNRNLIIYDTTHKGMSETELWQLGTTEIGKR